MNKDILELCQWVMKKTLENGASDCKVSVDKRRFVDLNYRDRKPETIKEATTQSLWLNIYKNGKYSAQGTPDLRKTTLEKFIEKGCENTDFIEKDPFRTLPEKKYIEGQLQKDLNLFDSSISQVSTDQRHQIAREIEAACIEKGGDKVISVEAGVNFTERERVIVASNGFENGFKITNCSAGASMSAQGEGDRKPSDYYWISTRHMNDMPDTAFIGKSAAERTLQLIGAKKLPSETLPIVIENRTVGRLLWGFISGLMGYNIQQEQSFLADKLNQKVASNKLTIVDNPFIEKGHSSKLFDNDGFPVQKRNVITEGVINTFFYDWYYSQKMGVEPTTGGTTNLEFGQGSKSLVELMKTANRGILVTGFIGGNSNSTTGDFSIGIIGHLFENGIPVQPIAEMNIADNHLNFWNKLVETGNDPWQYGSWRMPSMLFENVVVAGK
jgi:PmbA protein